MDIVGRIRYDSAYAQEYGERAIRPAQGYAEGGGEASQRPDADAGAAPAARVAVLERRRARSPFRREVADSGDGGRGGGGVAGHRPEDPSRAGGMPTQRDRAPPL